MSQLFLAVEKAAGAGLKGHFFSRYGPAKHAIGPYPFDRYPPKSRRTSTLLPTTSRAVTATTAITYPSSPIFPAIDRVGLLLPVKMGRLNVLDLAVLLRTLNLNALEAPSLPEGVF